MLSRPTHILAAVAIFGALTITACKSRYSDVYSFKKNSFVAPTPVPTKVEVPPTTEGLPGQQPGAPTDPGAMPGATVPATGVPGLDPVPAAPAPSSGIPGL